MYFLNCIVTFTKLTKIAAFLQEYYSKVRAKGEERIKNTWKTIEKLSKKKASYSESTGVKIDYSKKLEDAFDIFSYKKTKNYPGSVIHVYFTLLVENR